MAGSVAADRKLDKKGEVEIIHYGLTYKPIPEVAIKIDHQRLEYQNVGLWTKTEDATDNTSNIGIAYMY